MTQQLPPQPIRPAGPPVPGPRPPVPPGPSPQAYAPPGGYPPPAVAWPPPAPEPPRKRRTGLVVGIVAAVLVLLAGGVAALFLFGTRTLDTAEAQRQIAKLTEQQLGVAPSGVRCPTGVEVKTGTTFTCTATVEGQAVDYAVKETDDKGNVHIDSTTRFVLASKLVSAVEQQVTQQTGLSVTGSCDTGGKQVLVDGFDRQYRCTVTNTADPTDTLDVYATVDRDGDVSITG